MSGGKGGGGSGTQVQRSEPWSVQAPYLSDTFQQAQNLYQGPGPQYFPYATYTPFSPQNEMAMGLTQQRALNGSPVDRAMQGYVTSTMQNPGGGEADQYLRSMMRAPSMGDAQSFANPGNINQARQSVNGMVAGGQNPFLDRMYDSAARRVTENFTDTVMPSLNASFAASGGRNSGIRREMALDASDELGQNLSDLAGNMYGNAYESDASRRLQGAGLLMGDNLQRLGLGADIYNRGGDRGIAAANAATGLLGTRHGAASEAARLAPDASNRDYFDIAQLGQVGDMVEDRSSQIIQDAMDRWNHYQYQPEDRLAQYIAAIQGNYGGTTRSGTLQSTGAGLLGGAMSGASMGGQVGGPWGAVIGGILGGAGGYFGARNNNRGLD